MPAAEGTKCGHNLVSYLYIYQCFFTNNFSDYELYMHIYIKKFVVKMIIDI